MRRSPSRLLMLLSCLMLGAVLAGSLAPAEDTATAARHFAVYGSTPKGVTLEGTAVGMEEIESVGYNARNNAFLLNGAVIYRNPVSAAHFAEILQALRRDTRIGVSITNLGKTIVYGALDEESEVVAALVRTDEFLSGVTFGRQEMIGNVRLPEGYVPRRVPVEKAPVATASSYGFLQYYFRKSDDGMHYRLADFELEILLVPLRPDYATDGGHLPDLALMDSGEEYLTPEAKANLGHLKGHRNEYLQMDNVRMTAAIGEAAAFARTLIASGVDLDALLTALAGGGDAAPADAEQADATAPTDDGEGEGAGVVPAGRGTETDAEDEQAEEGAKRRGLFERIF